MKYKLYQTTIGSLCADDYKGANNQYVGQDKLIIETVEGGGIVMDRAAYNQGKNAKYDFMAEESETMPTLVAKGTGAVAYEEETAYCIGNGQVNKAMTLSKEVSRTLNCMDDPMKVMTVKEQKYIVRRLTPMECERLQGYPDGWTDIGDWTDTKGKTHKTSDAARYKALGNSIALPFWKWLLDRFPEDCKTMGSLFDGIGGFPKCWEDTHGKGSCRWASEIEEFCIAVTKKHFGED